MAEAAGNAEQIDYWNKQGTAWVNSQERTDRMLASLTEAALKAAQPGDREQVLDVGCGCGDTSIALAQSCRRVSGIDVSAPMLERARQRGRELANLTFLERDAATHAFTPDHDLVFSRFGVMFFTDPVAAFSNLLGALAPDGRLLFMCWQAPGANPWMSAGARAVRHLLPAQPPADPRAPGPFAFADADYVDQIMVDAGFNNVRVDGFKTDVNLGTDLDAAVAGQLEIGPLSRALKSLEPAQLDEALTLVKSAMAPFFSEEGLLMPAAVWLVSATR